MGFKRPFDSEDFQELPFKQTRQIDYSNKLTQFGSLHTTKFQEPNIMVYHEGRFGKSQQQATLENNSICEVSNLVKDVEFSGPRSLITSCSSDDDIMSGVAAYSSFSAEHSGYDYTRRLEPFGDAYSSYLDRSPRRQVPLGPNHQASIPVWGGHFDKNQLEQKDSFGPNSSSLLSDSAHSSYNVDEERLMGTCIMPMPVTESSADSSNDAGGDRTGCRCVDEGSGRCVRQHIMEAREELRQSLGLEKFVNLGFYDMGEDITHKWSEEEEQVFHSVIYSNPASLGHNFWRHLSQVFPTRSTKEIVSYYFNVFMLRRRAAQNRSNFLDIDSDDDELHGINRGSYKVQVLNEDNDSDIESIDQFNDADHGEYTFAEGCEHDNNGEDDDDDSDDSDGDLGDSSGDATGEDSGIDNFSEPHDMKSFDGSKFNDVVKHVDCKGGMVTEDFTVRDNSCMSFEFQADKVVLCDPVESGTSSELRGISNDDRECVPGNGNGYSDEVDQAYLLDPCDAKAWDARYSVATKGVSFLPTCNIIEEIFGQGTSGDENMK